MNKDNHIVIMCEKNKENIKTIYNMKTI